MSSRWSSIAVCLLWLIAMGWLFWEKVLPPLLLGDPPSYRTIADSRNYREPVGWKLFINGRPVGSALSTALKLAGDRTEIKSRVVFDHVPLEELTPNWLRGKLGSLLVPQAGDLKMESESTLTVDAEGRLAKFRSALHVQSMARCRGALRRLRGGAIETDHPLRRFHLPHRGLSASEVAGGRHALAPGLLARTPQGADLDGALVQPVAARE